MIESKKRAKLSSLARARSMDQDVGVGYDPSSVFGAGKFDDYPSPWSVMANNVDADVMSVGQDWCSLAYINALDPTRCSILTRLGHDPELPTNQRLRRLFRLAFHKEIEQSFCTNAFVFLKKGGISASIPPREIDRSVARYLLPQIEIVGPRLVICLGQQTLHAVKRSLGIRSQLGGGFKQEIEELIALPLVMSSGTRIVGAPHPGGRGTANYGGDLAVQNLWIRFRDCL